MKKIRKERIYNHSPPKSRKKIILLVLVAVISAILLYRLGAKSNYPKTNLKHHFSDFNLEYFSQWNDFLIEDTVDGIKIKFLDFFVEPPRKGDKIALVIPGFVIGSFEYSKLVEHLYKNYSRILVLDSFSLPINQEQNINSSHLKALKKQIGIYDESSFCVIGYGPASVILIEYLQNRWNKTENIKQYNFIFDGLEKFVFERKTFLRKNRCDWIVKEFGSQSHVLKSACDKMKQSRGFLSSIAKDDSYYTSWISETDARVIDLSDQKIKLKCDLIMPLLQCPTDSFYIWLSTQL